MRRFALLVLMLLVCLSAFPQVVTHSYPALDTNNGFSGPNTFNGPTTFNGTFSLNGDLSFKSTFSSCHRNADWYLSGTDWCSKVNLAKAEIGSTECTIHVTKAAGSTSCSADIALGVRQSLVFEQGGDFNLQSHELKLDNYASVRGQGIYNTRLLESGALGIGSVDNTRIITNATIERLAVLGTDGGSGFNTVTNAIGVDVFNAARWKMDDLYVGFFQGTGAVGVRYYADRFGTYYSHTSRFHFDSNTNNLLFDATAGAGNTAALNGPNRNMFEDGLIYGGSSNHGTCTNLNNGATMGFTNVNWENCNAGASSTASVLVNTTQNHFESVTIEDHSVGAIGLKFTKDAGLLNTWTGSIAVDNAGLRVSDSPSYQNGNKNTVRGAGWPADTGIVIDGTTGVPDNMSSNTTMLVGNPSGTGYSGKWYLGDNSGTRKFYFSSRFGAVDTDYAAIDDFANWYQDAHTDRPLSADGNYLEICRPNQTATADHNCQWSYRNKIGTQKYSWGVTASGGFTSWSLIASAPPSPAVGAKTIFSHSDSNGNTEMSGTGSGGEFVGNNTNGAWKLGVGDGTYNYVFSIDPATGDATWHGNAARTQSFKFTGTPSSNQVITVPDETATMELTSHKAAASGYASLDSSAKVPVAQLANLLSTANSWTAGQTVAAQGTATSGGGFSSFVKTMQSSFWNGSVAVTDQFQVWVSASSSNGFFNIKHVSGAANAFLALTDVGIQMSPNTNATSGANVSGPTQQFLAKYWDGTTSQFDGWNIQNVMGTGSNPTSTLKYFRSSGSSTGAAVVQFPAVQVGTSGSTISDTRELVQSAHSCGTTTTCANTANGSNRMIFGSVVLAAGTATITGITPSFASTTSWGCSATDQTTTAVAMAVPASTSSLTVTGTGTDKIWYQCIGN